MSQRIEVVREAKDGLHREVFDFYFMEYQMELVLDKYLLQSRASKRHHFVPDLYYHRLRSGVSGFNSIPVEQVPLTEDITAEAKAQFFAQIKVVKWKN